MRSPTLPNAPELRDRPGRAGSLRPQIALSSGVKLEKICRRCRRNRLGVAAVEFAVIAPVFFLLILGMIEFGRMVMVQQVITNASREGARIAVLDGTTESEVLVTVDNYLSSARVGGATVTVDPTNPNAANYGEPVTVSVSVPFNQVSWLPSSFFGNDDTVLAAATVMRRETVQ